MARDRVFPRLSGRGRCGNGESRRCAFGQGGRTSGLSDTGLSRSRSTLTSGCSLEPRPRLLFRIISHGQLAVKCGNPLTTSRKTRLLPPAGPDRSSNGVRVRRAPARGRPWGGAHSSYSDAELTTLISRGRCRANSVRWPTLSGRSGVSAGSRGRVDAAGSRLRAGHYHVRGCRAVFLRVGRRGDADGPSLDDRPALVLGRSRYHGACDGRTGAEVNPPICTTVLRCRSGTGRFYSAGLAPARWRLSRRWAEAITVWQALVCGSDPVNGRPAPRMAGSVDRRSRGSWRAPVSGLLCCGPQPVAPVGRTTRRDAAQADV